MPTDISLRYQRYCEVLSYIVSDKQAMEDLYHRLSFEWQSAWSSEGNGLIVNEHSIGYRVSNKIRENFSHILSSPKIFYTQKKVSKMFDCVSTGKKISKNRRTLYNRYKAFI